MAVALLDLVEKALRVAKQALGNHAGKPESGGLPREAHIVAHCIRKEEGHTFTELVDRLGLMPDICDRLGIHPDALPDPTTFYHSLDRYAMYVWRALLRASAQQLRQSGHVALDSTFFERKQASQYYLQRRNRAVKSLRDALKYYGGVDTRPIVESINCRLDSIGADVDDHFLENGHGENVFDFTTNVPFVLAGSGVEPATVTAQIRQIDVLPTILDALGIDGDTDGDPIRPADGVDDRAAYIRARGTSLHCERNWARAIRYDDAKYVEYPERDWSPGVYDIERDPQELAHVDDPDLEAALSERLPERGIDPTGAEKLAINERLKSLGYR